MEKRRPHYRLSEVQAFVADPTTRPFTVTALRGGTSLGLTEKEMRQVVLTLTHCHFYKSMTTHADPAVWQDVYHGMTAGGEAVYIKITWGSKTPVIQFKRR